MILKVAEQLADDERDVGNAGDIGDVDNDGADELTGEDLDRLRERVVQAEARYKRGESIPFDKVLRNVREILRGA